MVCNHVDSTNLHDHILDCHSGGGGTGGSQKLIEQVGLEHAVGGAVASEELGQIHEAGERGKPCV